MSYDIESIIIRLKASAEYTIFMT